MECLSEITGNRHSRAIYGLNQLFFGLTFFMFCSTFLPAYFSGAASPEDLGSGIVARSFQFLVYSYILVTGACYSRTFLRVFFSNPLLVLTILLMLLSCLWSVDRGLTFYITRVNFFMAVAIISGLAILGYRGAIDVCAIVFCIIIWCSIYFAIFIPSWGIQGEVWRGIFSNKNTVGAFACIATGLLILKALSKETQYRLFWWLNAVLGFVLLLFSKSATSFAGFVVAILLLSIWIFLKKLRGYLIIFLPIVLILAVLMVPVTKNYIMPFFLGAFEKDMSLTGRTDVWDAAFKVFLKRPLLGYGHGAFWRGDGAEGRAPILLSDENVPPHAHNQWLETAIGMGVVGLFITLFWGLHILIRAAKASAAEEGGVLRHYGLFVVLAVTIICISEVPLLTGGFTTFIIMLNYLSFSFLQIKKKEIND